MLMDTLRAAERELISEKEKEGGSFVQYSVSTPSGGRARSRTMAVSPPKLPSSMPPPMAAVIGAHKKDPLLPSEGPRVRSNSASNKRESQLASAAVGVDALPHSRLGPDKATLAQLLQLLTAGLYLNFQCSFFFYLCYFFFVVIFLFWFSFCIYFFLLNN